jgi:hypothetical protein
MKTDFYKKNKSILNQKRGAGYWLWKSYLIDKNLQEMNEGDVLIYLDCGVHIENSINHLVNLTIQNDIVLFKNNHHTNKYWTKGAVFKIMDLENEKYYNGQQVVGGYLVIKKNSFSVRFVKEWLKYSQDSRLITDEDTSRIYANFPEFIDHRHDQSILSLLAIKHNIELFRDPSQWGNKYKLSEFRELNEFCENEYMEHPMVNSQYPTILYSHRKIFKPSLKRIIQYYFQKSNP